MLFRATWKLQPSVGIANTTRRARSRSGTGTGGDFVHAGQAVLAGLSLRRRSSRSSPASPDSAQIRHSISPVITYNYSPAAAVPEEFARAVALPGQRRLAAGRLRPRASLLGLSQNFEAKGKPAPGDTTGASARKFRLLSINTSPARLRLRAGQAAGPHRLDHPAAHQLVRERPAARVHPHARPRSLGRRRSGSRGRSSSRFSQSVSANFATHREHLPVARLAVRPGEKLAHGASPHDAAARTSGRRGAAAGRLPPQHVCCNRLRSWAAAAGRFRPTSRSTYPQPSRDRTRRPAAPRHEPQQRRPQHQLLADPLLGRVLVDPVQRTPEQFESQQIQLTRDLHEWRAAFNFLKTPNGNFAFYFSVFLTDLPALKFDYNQTTIQP